VSISETPSLISGGTPNRPAVYAVIPAYGGAELLARVIASLETEMPLLRGVLVVNNARDPDIDRVAANAHVPTTVFTPRCNLGTAGGLAFGLSEFLTLPDATHAWILDDDALATPGALDAMLSALNASGADAASSLLADADGRVRGITTRIPGKSRGFLRRGLTRNEFLQACGDAPMRWNWALWASVLITRRAIEATGFPRLELWSQFSDVDYLLRLTERHTGVLAPRALCHHIPVTSSGASFDAKLHAALQNGSYVAFRLAHGRRARRHLPGLLYRYVRHYRWRPKAMGRAVSAFWMGAVKGCPSGRTMAGSTFAEAERELARLMEAVPPRGSEASRLRPIEGSQRGRE
jgi:GT2 family glycosyltransferase